MSTETAMTADSKSITPESIMQLGLGFWGSKTLLSAIELGLFTELAKAPLTAEELSARLRLHPRSARDFFAALVALGMPSVEAIFIATRQRRICCWTATSSPTSAACLRWLTKGCIRFGVR